MMTMIIGKVYIKKCMEAKIFKYKTKQGYLRYIKTLDKIKLYNENYTLIHLIQDLRLNHNILVAKLYCDFFLTGKAYLDSINDETKLKKYCLKFIARLNEFIQNNMIKLKSFKNYKQKHCDYDGVTPKRDLIEIITNLYGDIIFRKESELSRGGQVFYSKTYSLLKSLEIGLSLIKQNYETINIDKIVKTNFKSMLEEAINVIDIEIHKIDYHLIRIKKGYYIPIK